MALKLKTKIQSGYIIAFILLLISYFLIFYTLQKMARGTRDVTGTYAAVNLLESLRSDLVDAETGVRGFVISGDGNFLQPYYSSVKSIPRVYNEIKNTGLSNANRQVQLLQLKQYMNHQMDLLAGIMELFRRHGRMVSDTMKTNLVASKISMDSIRAAIDRFKVIEENLIQNQVASLHGFFRSTQIIAITSLLIAVITVIFSLVTYNRENKAKEFADNQAARYQAELEAKLKELKKANAELYELKQTEKFAATGRIARTIAHEVRNPLTNITLATEQLQETVGRNEDSDLLLEMLMRNASRIEQLVSELLHSTRFAQLDFEKSNIHVVLDEALSMAADRIELKHITVKKKFANGLCDISVDPEKMKLAFLNIIVNAIEAIEKEEGLLEITTKVKRETCEIEIRDNGIGMDDETMQKIFDPYFTGKINGNGLGLTHSQNIIYNHNGRVTVSSEKGRGSTFRVILDRK